MPVIPEVRGYRGEVSTRGEVRGYRGEVRGYRGEVRGYRGEVSTRGEVRGYRGEVRGYRDEVSTRGEVRSYRGKDSQGNYEQYGGSVVSVGVEYCKRVSRFWIDDTGNTMNERSDFSF